MSRTAILGIGAILLGLQSWFCISRNAPRIQNDLLQRSSAALAAANLPTSGLTMDGREAVLAGYRGSLHISAAAIETVRNVRGVRTVSTQILELGAGQAEAVEKSIADLLKLKKIEFEKASAGLTPTGRQTLDEVAALLAKWPGVPIEISGHTDSLGAAEVNLDLSNRRAAAVKQYLVAKNIELSRLTSVGYGPTRPIATNETDAGRQANRRIEFHVKEAK